MELVLASVFTALFGSTRGPEVLLFKQFQKHWSYIHQKTYAIAADDMFDPHTVVLRAEMVAFCKAALYDSHPKEDYEEFLKLA